MARVWDSEIKAAKELVQGILSEEAHGDIDLALCILLAVVIGKLHDSGLDAGLARSRKEPES